MADYQKPLRELPAQYRDGLEGRFGQKDAILIHKRTYGDLTLQYLCPGEGGIVSGFDSLVVGDGRTVQSQSGGTLLVHHFGSDVTQLDKPSIDMMWWHDVTSRRRGVQLVAGYNVYVDFPHSQADEAVKLAKLISSCQNSPIRHFNNKEEPEARPYGGDSRLDIPYGVPPHKKAVLRFFRQEDEFTITNVVIHSSHVEWVGARGSGVGCGFVFQTWDFVSNSQRMLLQIGAHGRDLVIEFDKNKGLMEFLKSFPRSWAKASCDSFYRQKKRFPELKR